MGDIGRMADVLRLDDERLKAVGIVLKPGPMPDLKFRSPPSQPRSHPTSPRKSERSRR